MLCFPALQKPIWEHTGKGWRETGQLHVLWEGAWVAQLLPTRLDIFPVHRVGAGPGLAAQTWAGDVAGSSLRWVVGSELLRMTICPILGATCHGELPSEPMMPNWWSLPATQPVSKSNVAHSGSCSSRSPPPSQLDEEPAANPRLLGLGGEGVSVAAGINARPATSEQDPTQVLPEGLGNREQKTFRTNSTDDTYLGTFSIHTPFLTPATFPIHTQVPAKAEANNRGQVAPVSPSQIITRQVGHVSAQTSSKAALGLLAPCSGSARTLW